MEIISMPRPMRWIWGSLGAYWLADMINPGFFSIALMALLMVPVLILDMYFPPEPEPSVGSEEQVEEDELIAEENADATPEMAMDDATEDLTEVPAKVP